MGRGTSNLQHCGVTSLTRNKSVEESQVRVGDRLTLTFFISLVVWRKIKVSVEERPFTLPIQHYPPTTPSHTRRRWGGLPCGCVRVHPTRFCNYRSNKKVNLIRRTELGDQNSHLLLEDGESYLQQLSFFWVKWSLNHITYLRCTIY